MLKRSPLVFRGQPPAIRADGSSGRAPQTVKLALGAGFENRQAVKLRKHGIPFHLGVNRPLRRFATRKKRKQNEQEKELHNIKERKTFKEWSKKRFLRRPGKTFKISPQFLRKNLFNFDESVIHAVI
jgi:hypothetical protein